MDKIILVEDDHTLSQNIKDALQAEGFEVDTVFDGTLAEKMLKKHQYDCVIMDINIPGKTGYTLCKEFRSYNTATPIIILTAFDELEDKVQGYDSGADDYLTKPFYMRELILRIQAVLKRSSTVGNESQTSLKIIADDIVIDRASRVVTRQGKEVSLTPREFQILLRLIVSKGEVLSKKDLVKEIWGTSFDSNTNTIEVYINFLRKKLDKPFGKDSIKTKVGFGYYFDEY